ncbi:MAG: hypothetical protein HYT16_04240 [DPANN group archaeon]|nr:hypothetical protein [DPANN group archaeon]
MANIKENMLAMKTKTEFMVDMAYSAIFTQDRQIAQKVEEIYGEVERLEDETLKLLFKIHIPDEERIAIINFADGIKDIANASVRIAHIALRKNFPAVLKEVFKDHKFSKLR